MSSKRRQSSDSSNSEAESETHSLVDVDFDFFSPEQIDFHGLKTLFRQLFPYHEIPSLDLSSLVDLVLDQHEIGTTVKVTDELDPYAILTCLDLNSKHECMKPLRDYVLQKGGDAFGQVVNSKQVALIINERLINMPPQIVPPMFTMLEEELKNAVQEKKPFNFSHYIYLSKTYIETEDVPKSKKKKSEPHVLHFQAEDEFLEQHALFKKSYKMQADPNGKGKSSFEGFGIDPTRQILLLDSKGLSSAILDMKEKIGGENIKYAGK